MARGKLIPCLQALTIVLLLSAGARAAPWAANPGNSSEQGVAPAMLTAF